MRPCVHDEQDTGARASTMDRKGGREIVVEFERIERIRRTAPTILMWCPECQKEVEHIRVEEAANLFGTAESDISWFLDGNNCHRSVIGENEHVACVGSLLDAMNRRKWSMRNGEFLRMSFPNENKNKENSAIEEDV